jgi:hypothetical protein
MNYTESIKEALEELYELDKELYDFWSSELCNEDGSFIPEQMNEQTNKKIWQLVSSLYPEEFEVCCND